ncbi:MAG TPA: hypothetical protein VGJ84_12310 [Polyangiaceae bacterium]|jgi:hypothetical protein
MRCIPALLVGAVTLTASASALGKGSCEEGDWFCEEEESRAEEPGEQEPAEEPPAQAEEAPPKKASGISVVDRTLEESPRPRRRLRHREWGLNLRIEKVLMGSDRRMSPSASMAGLGFSLRLRPIGYFAFDAGLDFFGGRDWNGFDRNETAFLLNGMVFFNPRDRLQIYTLVGLGLSRATVNVLPVAGVERELGQHRFSYFGGQIGIGAEFRIVAKTAINVDLVGFARGRTDSKTRSVPEFIDPSTHYATNASNGGLLRGGLTFYW